jgi:hypothetical protein
MVEPGGCAAQVGMTRSKRTGLIQDGRHQSWAGTLILADNYELPYGLAEINLAERRRSLSHTT